MSNDARKHFDYVALGRTHSHWRAKRTSWSQNNWREKCVTTGWQLILINFDIF
jgi:hypothetical protein